MTAEKCGVPVFEYTPFTGETGGGSLRQGGKAAGNENEHSVF
jgi:hypothetical protein